MNSLTQIQSLNKSYWVHPNSYQDFYLRPWYELDVHGKQIKSCAVIGIGGNLYTYYHHFLFHNGAAISPSSNAL